MKRYRWIGCKEFGRRLIRKRPVERDTKLQTPLKRCLNAVQLTLYCIAHMIGAGLYVLTGQLIRDDCGPGTAVAYLLSAFTAAFTAMCYAEFTTLFPRAGSAYVYTYLMFGELPAFLIGWTMVSDVIVSTAAISKALSGTINLLSNNTIRQWSEKHLVRLHTPEIADSSPDLIAALFLLLLIVLTLTGANISLNINAVLSSIQIICLVVMIIACFVLGNPENYVNEGGFFPFGISGMLRGAGLAVFGFSGFEAVANASEEAKTPRRDLPMALFSALGICALLYVGASLGLSYLVPRTNIVYDSPFVAAFSYVKQTGLMGFAAFATLLATGATKLVAMYVIPRLFYSIASDGLLFGIMAYVEPRTGVPIWSLLFGGMVTVLLATFVKIQVLAEFTSVGIIFSYFMIGLDLMALRYTFEDVHHVLHQESGIEKSKKNLTKLDSMEDESILIPLHHGLRMRKCVPSHLTMFETKTHFQLILTTYSVSVLAIGIILNINIKNQYTWLWVTCGLFGVVTIISFVLLSSYEPTNQHGAFETPVLPIAPCLTVLTNGILITSMQPLTWLRFVIWSVIGLIIYLGYGMWFSKADEAVEVDDAPERSDLVPLELSDGAIKVGQE